MSDFDTNLMRAHLAAVWFSISLQTARELFGRGYLSLSVAERAAVDQIVQANVGSAYQAITPEWLAAQQARPAMGFQVSTGAQPSAPTSPSLSKT